MGLGEQQARAVARLHVGGRGHAHKGLGWKLVSFSHCHEFSQHAVLASDWLFTLVQPIRSQLVILSDVESCVNLLYWLLIGCSVLEQPTRSHLACLHNS